MYLSGGSNCGGCNGGFLGDYLGNYLGQETPWWEQLIYTGERIATNVLQQKPSTFPTYGGGAYTPPMFPASYPPAYAEPAGITEATNWLPYVLVGGLALYLLTR